MTTLDELIEEQQQLQRFVIWMEKRELHLRQDGLSVLDWARADLRAVNEQIAARTV